MQEFQEALTTVLMTSGLPKMMARVMGCLYTADNSLTASDLAQRLQVSPASVSKAVTFLADLDLIRRESDGRRERYVIDNDLWYQSMLRSVRDNDRFSETARQGAAVLGRDTPAGNRLENAARFLDFVSESLNRAVEQARDVLYTKPETSPAGAEPDPDRG